MESFQLIQHLERPVRPSSGPLPSAGDTGAELTSLHSDRGHTPQTGDTPLARSGHRPHLLSQVLPYHSIHLTTSHTQQQTGPAKRQLSASARTIEATKSGRYVAHSCTPTHSRVISPQTCAGQQGNDAPRYKQQKHERIPRR